MFPSTVPFQWSPESEEAARPSTCARVETVRTHVLCSIMYSVQHVVEYSGNSIGPLLSIPTFCVCFLAGLCWKTSGWTLLDTIFWCAMRGLEPWSRGGVTVRLWSTQDGGLIVLFCFPYCRYSCAYLLLWYLITPFNSPVGQVRSQLFPGYPDLTLICKKMCKNVNYDLSDGVTSDPPDVMYWFTLSLLDPGGSIQRQ